MAEWLASLRTTNGIWLSPSGILGVVADQMGDVDAGDGVAGHGPRRRNAPVAAVDQPSRGVGVTGRLVLRKRHRGLDVGGDLAGAIAAVVAEPEDVDVILVDGVLILNETVWPTLTLIDVAKP